MADQSAPAVSFGENSPEQVAYKLMALTRGTMEPRPDSVSAILDLYAECLEAVRGLRNPSDGATYWHQRRR